MKDLRDYSKWKDWSVSDSEWADLLDQTNELILQYYFSKDISQKTKKQLLTMVDELEATEMDCQLKNFEQYLFDLGVRKLDCEFDYEMIRKKWIESFCADLSKKQLSECYVNDQLWHVFSYKLICDCKWGEDAKKEFDSADKREIYLFSEAEWIYHLSIPDNNVTSSTFRLLYNDDIHFVDKDFRWTYIFTHEFTDNPIWYKI